MKLLFALVVLVNNILIVICAGSCCCANSPTYRPVCSNIDDAVDRFSKTNFQYAADIYRYLIRTFPKKNVIASPLASLYITSILGLYSCGRSQCELLRGLNLKSKTEIRCVISTLDRVISGPMDGIFLTANGSNIFANIQYPLSESFRRDMQELIIGNAFNTDFSKPKQAANFINSVVANETYNNITNIITEENNDFSEKTQLKSVTGLYFEGQYIYRFATENIKKGYFYGALGTQQAEFISQRAVYNYTYSNELGSDVLAIPYLNTYIGIFIVPSQDTDLDFVINQIGDQELIQSVIESLVPTDVNVTLSTYDNITTNFDVAPVAADSLNFTTIYDPNCAQFEGITKNKNQCVSLSGGVQEIVLQTNTNGGPLPDIPKGLPTAQVNVNRPYFDLIIFKVKSTYIPLFTAYRSVV